jgi:hypothetical protein
MDLEPHRPRCDGGIDVTCDASGFRLRGEATLASRHALSSPAPEIQTQAKRLKDPHSHFGNSQKNTCEKWKNLAAPNHAFKTPQCTINPPQTHHEFTIKKHRIFANPLQKTQ